MSELDEVINEFVVESYENLDQLDRDLLALEDDPDDPTVLASIFRTIHTVKGTCGFLGFSKLESITHVGENLLSKLRDGELRLTPEMANALLALSDAVRSVLGEIERTASEGDADYATLRETLTRLKDGGAAPAAPSDDERLGALLVAGDTVTDDQVTDAVSRQILGDDRRIGQRSEEHTSELQSPCNIVC